MWHISSITKSVDTLWLWIHLYRRNRYNVSVIDIVVFYLSVNKFWPKQENNFQVENSYHDTTLCNRKLIDSGIMSLEVNVRIPHACSIRKQNKTFDFHWDSWRTLASSRNNRPSIIGRPINNYMGYDVVEGECQRSKAVSPFNDDDRTSKMSNFWWCSGTSVIPGIRLLSCALPASCSSCLHAAHQ